MKFYFGIKRKIFEILFFGILREKPDVILLQQTGTFALTFIITQLSTLYDDESIQIGINSLNRLYLNRNILDSPNNCNYISIFTRKSNIKKKNVSIIKNSENWKMLKVEVNFDKMCFYLYSIYF